MGDDNTNSKRNFNELQFFKLCASGNDFIVILDLENKFTESEGSFLAKKLCRPKFGIGADGLIFIKPPEDKRASFKWMFFNSDGSQAEMCGNGARCVVRLVEELSLFKSPLYFQTLAGLIYAESKGSKIKVALTSPKDLKLNQVLRTEYDWFLIHFVNTGVPHVVIFWEDLDNAPVEKLGAKIRYHEMFAPEGTNVNFVSVESEEVIRVRTYERGVEAETLACGTGASASAYISYKLGLVKSPVKVKTQGGEILTIYIENQNGRDKLFLEGETLFLFKGETNSDILK